MSDKPEPKVRPLQLRGEPPLPLPAETETFFGLDAIEDPLMLLARSTDLAEAFGESARRAGDYQAVAAARLTDPRRFDRMPIGDLASITGWTEVYAAKMAEYGWTLIEKGAPWD